MKPLRVSELNGYIKRIISGDIMLSNVQVEGEISNFKHHFSGHMYFSLKDEKSKIPCVMFKGDNDNLNIKLEEGLKIIATGYVSVYDRDGSYQLYIKKIEQKGKGDLFKKYEELKKKLEDEGLFDATTKKEIPYLPKCIGVVTSLTGAAVRDIVSVLKRRYPPCNIIIYPTLVQGLEASKEICKALKYLDSMGNIGLIITGRGGGSIEELFAFNDEELARTIYNLKTPVISAVGHETDFTIADFVADLRAPTPSAAAELSVPDISHLNDSLKNKYKVLMNLYIKKINSHKQELRLYQRSLDYNSPTRIITVGKQEIDGLFKDLTHSIDKKLRNETNRLSSLENKLNMLDLSMNLGKGFGILYDESGKVIKSIDDLFINQKLNILLEDGKLKTIITNINKGGLLDGRN